MYILITNKKIMIFIIYYLLYLFVAFRYKFKKVFTIIYNNKNIYYSFKELIDYEYFINIDLFIRDYKKDHIKIVTNNLSKIKDIIVYLKREIRNIKIVERNTLFKFKENIKNNIKNNKFFWSQGNNFYFYNVIYGYKKNVISYKNINKFIYNSKNMIFSKEYYESLESYNDDEIELFLFFNVFFVSNNTFKHGFHRLFAMIGRIVHNKKYIPMYIIKK
jgi:hypothetical protein